ncbi:hypothetical protein DSCA_41770 [Desulfosarcina alkanivorans]|uniref:Uncharacterized protein n=1 Tax=Desulfosarcina alkanivorans TaxID=571177 RepID=A0A5K7Z086_9BACT|nr:hypothetical protein [Desulfosarcina alkanivorans]BBO70247.1 hypothetical protein DSCA_41770 [Desulfosarcina alkanivorans]
MPGARQPGVREAQNDDPEPLTYGRYFTAILNFCTADGWQRIVKAASRKLARPVVKSDLEHLSIFLEKHGAFYHPARLQVAVKNQRLSFVVNVAASRRGRRALTREAAALKTLEEQRPFGWFPRVYDLVCNDPPMVLGDWFDGFHEFHLTRRPDANGLAIVVWDGAADRRLLSEGQAGALYRNAAMILTACYDPVTSNQIFPWHHAAGDFVVRLEGEEASVKLITVRDYIPMTGSTGAPANETEILDALVVFFIQLSVRMRLDRLDGVKEVVWAPDSCLEPVMAGFFQGLDLTARINGFPEGFPEMFRHYISRHEAADLSASARRVAETVFDHRSEERRVAAGNLDSHMQMIYRRLSA